MLVHVPHVLVSGQKLDKFPKAREKLSSDTLGLHGRTVVIFRRKVVDTEFSYGVVSVTLNHFSSIIVKIKVESLF